MDIKTKFLFLFLISLLNASDTETIRLENNATMELIKAYVDANDSQGLNTAKIKQPTRDDYAACKKQNIKAFVSLFGTEAVTIDERHALSFLKNQPSSYQVYDPFYDFYVLNSKQDLPFVKKADPKECKNNSFVGAITKNDLQFGHLISENYLDFDAIKGALLVNPCCEMLGISLGDNSYLPIKYLEQIVKRKTPFNGYVGADFKQDDQGVYVKNIDPFLKRLNFCPNDKILEVNDEKITSQEQLFKIVLSANIGSKLHFVIKRANKKKDFIVQVQKMPKYQLSALAFLDNIGLDFNSNLTIHNVKKDSFAQKSGLKKGDKLLEINLKKIKNLNEVRNMILYEKNEKFHFLFTRHDFQFFVKFNKKDVKGGLVELSHCPAI